MEDSKNEQITTVCSTDVRPDPGGHECSRGREAASVPDSEAGSGAMVTRSSRGPLAAVGPGADPLTAPGGGED